MLASLVLQIIGPGDQLTTILYIVLFIVFMLVSLLWAQRIQSSMILSEAGRILAKLQTLKDDSRKELENYIMAVCKAPRDSQARIDQTIEYFTIMPVSLDPKGVVDKIEHV